MRIGSFARSHGRLVALLVAATATALSPLATFGQVRNASYDSRSSAGSQGPQQALYNTYANDGANAQASRYVDANGNQMVVPAGCFCEQCCGGYGGDGGCGGGCYGGGGCGYGGGGGCGYGNCGCQGGYPGCCPMGAGGTDPAVGYDLMNDVGIAGNLVDQRGPHYFDVRAEAVYLQRDKSFEPAVDMSALNFGGPVVLSTTQLDIEDPEVGFRVVGRYDICPLSVVEFGYMGIFGWSDSASVEDPTGNLYSLFSRPSPGTGAFGQSPQAQVIPGVPPVVIPPVTDPLGPNRQTEQALSHSITLESSLQSAEISYRRYWLGYIPRVSGTLLGGFRYTRLDENFEFDSQGSRPLAGTTLPLAALEYNEDCENHLAGFQIGGDIWVSLCQGLRVGSEAKVGVYNNHSRLINRISTTPDDIQPPALFEVFKDDHVAFISEGSFDVVADILPSLSLRAGYEVLFLNELVLAGENFNQTSPYGNQGARVPFVVTDGEMFYHGAHAGFEYVW